MFTAKTNSGSSFSIPSLYEIQGEPEGLSVEEFKNQLVEKIHAFFMAKVSVANTPDSFKELIYKNWIHVALFIDKVYAYLTEGSGTAEEYFRSIRITDEEVDQLAAKLFAGNLKETSPGIALNTVSIQDSWDDYAQDKMNAFYNFAFNVFYMDLYLMPAFLSLTTEYSGSSISSEDLAELAVTLANTFNLDFGEAFLKFESDLKKN